MSSRFGPSMRKARRNAYGRNWARRETLLRSGIDSNEPESCTHIPSWLNTVAVFLYVSEDMGMQDHGLDPMLSCTNVGVTGLSITGTWLAISISTCCFLCLRLTFLVAISEVDAIKNKCEDKPRGVYEIYCQSTLECPPLSP